MLFFFDRTQRTANRVLTARSAAFLGAFLARSAGFEKIETAVGGFEARSAAFLGGISARSAGFEKLKPP